VSGACQADGTTSTGDGDEDTPEDTGSSGDNQGGSQTPTGSVPEDEGCAAATTGLAPVLGVVALALRRRRKRSA
jgi:uncharacterized protein (TIGR03382 family)